MQEIFITYKDLNLSWVTKNSGTVHYCYEKNGRIWAKVHESYNGLCNIDLTGDNNQYYFYGEYISLALAKKAVEEKLLADANTIVNVGLK